MGHHHQRRQSSALLLGLAALTLFWCGLPFAKGVSSNSDRVAELEKALSNFTPDRQSVVKMHISALRKFGELRRALALQGWRHTDQPLKNELIDRFANKIRGILEKGSPAKQEAVVKMLGEMGPLGSAADWSEGGKLAHPFAPDLIPLIDAADARVRIAAVRALANINPPPGPAVKALATILESKAQPALQQAAAEGLRDLVRVARQQFGDACQPRDPQRPDPRSQLIAVCRDVVPATKEGLKNAHAPVRQAAIEAIEAVATALQTLIPAPRDPSEFGGNPGAMAKFWQSQQEMLLPLIKAITSPCPQVIRNLQAKEVTVALAASRGLEAIAEVRSKFLLWNGLTRSAADREKSVKTTADAQLGKALADAVRPLARNLGHADVRVKLASLYVLETLEAEAAPALGDLVAALKDKNAFVRWGAARALGKMAPLQGKAAGQAVQGLATILADANPDVRLTAAVALGRYGPASMAALDALLVAAQKEDPGMQVRVLHSLMAIGTAAKKTAAPAVAKLLGDRHAQVRAAAALALGRFAPVQGAIEKKLRAALNDPAPAVRLAASEALLASE